MQLFQMHGEGFFVFFWNFYTFQKNFTYCKNAVCLSDERYLI